MVTLKYTLKFKLIHKRSKRRSEEKEPEREASYQRNGSLPKRVQKRAPSTGSGREAKRALNFPIMPKASMRAAPYCITRRLPTCGTHQRQRKAFISSPA